jgi:hypothetical protein
MPNQRIGKQVLILHLFSLGVYGRGFSKKPHRPLRTSRAKGVGLKEAIFVSGRPAVGPASTPGLTLVLNWFAAGTGARRGRAAVMQQFYNQGPRREVLGAFLGNPRCSSLTCNS